jgi:abelson tyrosine-protein kinase 1
MHFSLRILLVRLFLPSDILNNLILHLKFSCALSGITRDLQSLTASNKGDSESELQDQTPDTDDSGAHSYPEAPTGTFFPPSATTSFKRAPVMGNRGLEQRGKKSRTYPPKDTASVHKVWVFYWNSERMLLCSYPLPISAEIFVYRGVHE